jgi:hypothetical protein
MKTYWKSTKTLCCDESWLPIRILDGVQLRTAISSFWLPVAPVAPVYCVNALDAAPPFVTIAKYLRLIFTFSQLFQFNILEFFPSRPFGIRTKRVTLPVLRDLPFTDHRPTLKILSVQNKTIEIPNMEDADFNRKTNFFAQVTTSNRARDARC